MIKHKTILTMVSLVFIGLGVQAQEVISTQGESYSNAAVNIDYTLGEVVTITGTNGIHDLTQGFHQTNWSFAGLEDNVPSYQVIIYPNPTSDILNIQTEIFENVSYKLYDAQGKIVLQGAISAEHTPVQVNQLAPGNYSLTLNKNSQNLKTFKLIKSL